MSRSIVHAQIIAAAAIVATLVVGAGRAYAQTDTLPPTAVPRFTCWIVAPLG